MTCLCAIRLAYLYYPRMALLVVMACKCSKADAIADSADTKNMHTT